MIFALGALFVKHGSNHKVKPFTPVVVANLLASLQFTFFWFFEGSVPSLSALWQPALTAAFFLAGQCCILSAVSYGDVSVATPVASSKVIVVTFLLTLLGEQSPTMVTWIAASLAMLGIVLINFIVPKSSGREILLTVVLALAAAFAFGCFDTCIHFFASDWGPGRIVPITYWFVAIYSLALLPFCDSLKDIKERLPTRSIFLGGLFVAIQAGFLVYALSQFNDAARVNVVYSLRGLWGVLFAWLLASRFGGNEAKLPLNIMLARMGGAVLLVVAVIITIMETQS